MSVMNAWMTWRPLHSIRVSMTSSGISLPSGAQASQSNRALPVVIHSSIYLRAKASELSPLGWEGGENSPGCLPNISCANRRPKIRTAAGLTSSIWFSSWRTTPWLAPSKSALRAFALGVVNDAGANQILALRRQAQQPDFGGNQPATGLLLMYPREHRHSAAQSFIHFFAGKLAGASSARLKFRTDIGGSQLRQFFHRDAVKPASVFVAEQKSSGVSIEHDDGFRSMFDEGAKARFTRGQRSGAFRHAAFQR